MNGFGFFLGFFALIVVLAVTVGGNENRNTTKDVGSATSSETQIRNNTKVTESEPVYTAPTNQSSQETTKPLTPREVENKVAQIYRTLDALREDIREATLRSPASPYAGKVTLRGGNVYGEDPDKEYLVIRAELKNASAIDISKWYVESYVTGETAYIPDGDRLMERWRSPDEEPIRLEPGETAYLMTGESPIDTSFRENMCTGYLTAERTFTPSLGRRCPSPRSELERFGTDIALDNDKCYDFIEKLSSCTTPDEELYARSKVGGTCSLFVENTFSHDACVRLHRYDPYFARDGYWRVYLNERNELWRSEREIIRLMDENDAVIAVLEY